MDNRRLFTIFIIVFVDLLGFSLILPLLPYYAEAFGATPLLAGLLIASYAVAQLAGAPILGRLSDRYGRRPILLVSIFGTFLGFLLLGFASSLAVLFAARILDGLTGGNISVAQAYITDVTDERNRTKGLGLLGAAFGLGFVLGPAIGGVLSQWGYAVPAFAAAALAGANLLATALFLPESLGAARRAELSGRAQGQAPLTLSALLVALRRPVVGSLLGTRFVFALAFAMFQSVFPLYAQYRLGLGPSTTGYVLAYAGILVVIVQGVVIPRASAHFRESALVVAAIASMAVSLAGWAFAPSLGILVIVMVPLSLAGGVFNTLSQSLLTKAVGRDEIGGTLGLAAALESLTRVVAPAAGAGLLQYLGAGAPGVFGAILLAALVPYAWRQLGAPGAVARVSAVSVPVEVEDDR